LELGLGLGLWLGLGYDVTHRSCSAREYARRASATFGKVRVRVRV